MAPWIFFTLSLKLRTVWRTAARLLSRRVFSPGGSSPETPTPVAPNP
jgi:hypothetical protein